MGFFEFLPAHGYLPVHARKPWRSRSPLECTETVAVTLSTLSDSDQPCKGCTGKRRVKGGRLGAPRGCSRPQPWTRWLLGLGSISESSLLRRTVSGSTNKPDEFKDGNGKDRASGFCDRQGLRAGDPHLWFCEGERPRLRCRIPAAEQRGPVGVNRDPWLEPERIPWVDESQPGSIPFSM